MNLSPMVSQQGAIMIIIIITILAQCWERRRWPVNRIVRPSSKINVWNSLGTVAIWLGDAALRALPVPRVIVDNLDKAPIQELPTHFLGLLSLGPVTEMNEDSSKLLTVVGSL